MKTTVDGRRHPDDQAGLRPSNFPRGDGDNCCHAITINKTPIEVYAFCENLKNLENVFKKDVHEFNWDVRLLKNESRLSLSWKNTEQSEIKTTGNVWINEAPQGLGTVMTILMDYSLPTGMIDIMLAKFKGQDVGTIILTNLKRLKCFLETGEIATVEGQTSGREEIPEENYLEQGSYL